MDPTRHKPLVYVAAAYAGNPLEWAHGLLRAAEALWRGADVVPVLPHLRLGNALWAHDDRLSYEWDLIRSCDAVVVIGGRHAPVPSEGVEQWTDFADGLGVPVLDGPAALDDWVRNR